MLQISKESYVLSTSNWHLTQHKTNTNNLIIKLLQSNWGSLLHLNTFLRHNLMYLNDTQSFLKNSKSVNPFYTNFSANDMKLVGVRSNLDYTPFTSFTKTPKTRITADLKKSLLHLFTSFVRVNLASQNELTTPHHTFKMFYITHVAGGVAIITLSKLFQRWKNFYFLTYNLYYHKVDILTFSPSFFKTEVLALNWSFSKQFHFMWRYARPFLIHKSNKITNHGYLVFRNLRALGLNVGVVTDVLYHAKTLYYLKRCTFYSLGLVPTIYNAYVVDFALPTAYESIFTQIFFIRFLIRVKQDASLSEFNGLKQTWFIPLTLTKYIPSSVGTLDTTYFPEIT